MWIAAFEVFFWAMLGLALGFIGHWWKSHADPVPDVIDKDRPFMNMALTEYSAVNYALDHEYDDVGYWKYDSLRNLGYYLTTGTVGMLVAVYITAEGHALARAAVCNAAGAIGLTPIFCP
jgi:hypothetical protein